MVQTMRRRKWKCHESGSSIFFDDLASQRFYLPISSPPHRERMKDFHSKDAMWEICFERGAKSIFRLSGEEIRQTGESGDDVPCRERNALIGRWRIFQNGYGEI